VTDTFALLGLPVPGAQATDSGSSPGASAMSFLFAAGILVPLGNLFGIACSMRRLRGQADR